MKQHITTKQLDELSENGREILFKWVGGYKAQPNCPEEYLSLNRLSIGQMIEFLDEQDDYFKSWYRRGESERTHTNRILEWEYSEELCDALWEAVKEVLENE